MLDLSPLPAQILPFVMHQNTAELLEASRRMSISARPANPPVAFIKSDRRESRFRDGRDDFIAGSQLVNEDELTAVEQYTAKVGQPVAIGIRNP